MRGLAFVIVAALWGNILCAETEGQALYEGRATLSVRIGGAILPAIGISCAGCHGYDAVGGREAGAGPSLLGLEPQLVMRAMQEGIGAEGRTLSPAMPRFVFGAPGDAAKVADYIASIGALQRTGLSAHELALTFGTGSAATLFADAFLERAAELAPRGVFGRRLVRRESGGFVTLAATERPNPTSAPQLFPLYTLRGNEDTRRVRGGFASLADQVAVLAQSAEEGVIIDPEERLTNVPAGWYVVAEPGGRLPTIALGSAVGKVDLRAGPVLILADEMALLGRFDGCLTLSDPRPAPDGADAPPLERYGRAAAEVLVATLTRCGRDCTRARLFETLDGLAIQVPGWPHLDYEAQPLTGTREVALRRMCLEPGDGLHPD